MNAEILLKMKNEVEAKDGQVKTLSGRIDEKYKQLRDKFKCSTLEAGEQKLDEIKAALSAKESELEAGIEKLKTDYNWSFLNEEGG